MLVLLSRIRTLGIMAGIILMCACSASHSDDVQKLDQLFGKKIALPSILSPEVQGVCIESDINSADFTIITYIDSSGCTSCRMKLREWESLIDDLKSMGDVSLNFIMILNSSKTDDLEFIIKRDNFKHSVCYDPNAVFSEVNRLPDGQKFHTFMVDEDSIVTIVGNPIENLKIRNLYKKHLSQKSAYTGSENICLQPSVAVGTIFPGDSVVKRFILYNQQYDMLTLQGITTSCGCINVTIDTDTILANQKAMLTVSFVANENDGIFCKYADIFFNEANNPQRISVNGYIPSK